MIINRFFFFSIRPTNLISGNTFDAKQKKEGGGGVGVALQTTATTVCSPIVKDYDIML